MFFSCFGYLSTIAFVAVFCLLLLQAKGGKDSKDTISSSSFDFLPRWQTIITDIPGPAYQLTSWNLSAMDGAFVNLTASVPGDLLTDLMGNKVIDDPYFDRNFLVQRDIWLGESKEVDGYHRLRTRTWVYSTSIDSSVFADASSDYFLVFEGVKMAAKVSVHGCTEGEKGSEMIFRNQFRRYSLPLCKVKSGYISVVVTFDPSLSTTRFMACSGGWDWAPYTRTVTNAQASSRMWTLGLVRPVYVIKSRTALIEAAVPTVYDLDDHDKSSSERYTGNFRVTVNVRLKDVPASDSGAFIHVVPEFDDPVSLPLNGSQLNIVVELKAKDVELWWPNGMGNHRLYSLDVAISDSREPKRNTTWMRRMLGFRHVALVTSNEFDTADAKRDGTGKHGMYFRVNGDLVWARGANVVPMDQLEGRWTDEGHTKLVESSVAAGMNMLRVWGGGAILPDAFYDACDESGILIYHDLMFVGEQNHGAKATKNVALEIESIIQRLGSHPSIVIWSGCNECTYGGGNMSVYEDFVFPRLAKIDDSRAIWPSSPSALGWESGVFSKNGLPNGKRLLLRHGRNDSISLESHGPYHRGFSLIFPGVNSYLSYNTYETNIPPDLAPEPTGPMYRNQFVSEFGASVFSSFESMSPFLPKVAWGLHGGQPPDSCSSHTGDEQWCFGNNPLAERNYPCDSRIQMYFGGNILLNQTGIAPFRRQLYMCMIGQALWMKGQIESLRSSNSFGCLIWQMNENWPTGGWGLVEYGPRSNQEGQIIGGRWKALMYLLKNVLYRDIIAACGSDKLCYIRNDGTVDRHVVLAIELWKLGSSKALDRLEREFFLKGGVGASEKFRLQYDLDLVDVVLLRVVDSSGTPILMEDNAYLWKTPVNIQTLYSPANIEKRILTISENDAVIGLSSKSIVLYTCLSTNHRGQFIENCFHLRPNEEKKARFLFEGTKPRGLGAKSFVRDLVIHHLGSPFSKQDKVARHGEAISKSE